MIESFHMLSPLAADDPLSKGVIAIPHYLSYPIPLFIHIKLTQVITVQRTTVSKFFSELLHSFPPNSLFFPHFIIFFPPNQDCFFFPIKLAISPPSLFLIFILC